MKTYGDLNFQEVGKIIHPRIIIKNTEQFPLEPNVGEFIFKNKTLYVCVDIGNNMPVWVPMTQTISAYNYVQNPASNTWIIEHNLNTGHPIVTVYDNAGKQIIPDEIELTSNNIVTVRFGIPITGKAAIVVGNLEGSTIPEYGYEHYQTTSSTTWNITHGLNKYPIIRVFVGNNEVQPASITHNSMNDVTITFSDPQVGVVRFI